MENNNQAILVNVRLEKDDIGEYKAISFKSKVKLTKRQLFLLVAVAIMTGITVLYTFLTKVNSSVSSEAANKGQITIWPMLLLFLLVLHRIVTPVMLKSKARREFDQDKLLQKEVEYTLSSEGFLAQSDAKTINKRWGEILKVVEMKQYFAIVEFDKSYNLIPKRCFTKEEDVTAAAVLMKSKLKEDDFELIEE